MLFGHLVGVKQMNHLRKLLLELFYQHIIVVVKVGKRLNEYSSVSAVFNRSFQLLIVFKLHELLQSIQSNKVGGDGFWEELSIRDVVCHFKHLHDVFKNNWAFNIDNDIV